MKRLLVIALLLAFNSLTAQKLSKEQRTYIDSLEKAFDNVCFLHDSLVNELTYVGTLYQIEMGVNASNNRYILSLIENIKEVDLQKQLIAADLIDVRDLLQSERKDRKKEGTKHNRDKVLIGVGSGAIGAIIGFFAAFFSR